MDETEQGVRSRMRQERVELERKLRDVERSRLQRSGGEQRAMARLDRLVEEIRVRDGDCKAFSEQWRERLSDATAEVERAFKAVMNVGDERAELTAALARLDSDAEFRRRMREARRLARLREDVAMAGERGLGAVAPEIVLLMAGEPLHYTEITRRALEAGLIRTRGKTPKQTISGYLNRNMQPGDKFVRVGPGVFDLAERHADGVSSDAPTKGS